MTYKEQECAYISDFYVHISVISSTEL